MKIKDLVVGSLCEMTLVVKSATARITKAQKPYLALEFYDGTDTINANYWDWAGKNIPEVNAILDITGQVTEWQGRKQLTVKTMVTNTTKILSDFAPTAEHNLSDIYKDAYAMMLEVKDDFLRDLGLAVMDALRHEWLTVPGAVRVHHNYIGGTLVHSHSTAKLARAMASQIPEANEDLCVVGAMLHDVGKLFTYRIDGVNIDRTIEGNLYDHIFIGAEFIGNFAESVANVDDSVVTRKLRLLRHVILSHHGRMEYGSPVTPMCIEAFIVHMADDLDATTEQLRAAARKVPENEKWTEKLFTLNNTPHLTPAYVDAVFQCI